MRFSPMRERLSIWMSSYMVAVKAVGTQDPWWGNEYSFTAHGQVCVCP